MTAAGLAESMTSASTAEGRRRGIRWSAWLLGIAGLLVLVSIVRLITGANDITSSGTTGAALRLAVPIGLAGLGGLWAERSGVVNIGLEGMMILGTWFGAWGAYEFGPWLGVVVGIIGGALGGLVLAIATVTFGVDHIVSGVAINILGAGVTRFLSALIFVNTPGGGATQSPSLPRISTVTVPGAEACTRWRTSTGSWSPTSPAFSAASSPQVSLLTIVAVLLLPATFFLLWRTTFGLRLRSCGENPAPPSRWA